MAETRPGWLASPRVAGSLALAIPIAIGVAVNLFPNYDARPEHFRGTYDNIVAAGTAYGASLVVMALAAALIALLALALTRVPGTPVGGVALAFAVPATGFFLTALTAIPAVVEVSRVRSGASSANEAAAASEAWAILSQTILLLAGVGGALAAFIALSVTAYRRRWIRPMVFWTAASVSVVVGVGGLSLGLIWVGLGLPAVVLMVTMAASLIVLARWPVADPIDPGLS